MSFKAHLLVTLVTLSTWLFVVRLVRIRRLRAKYALLWMTVGTVMVVLAASPRLLDRVSLLVGISNGPTTLFLAANLLLLLIAVHFSWELSRLEERTRALAEEVAILKVENPPARS